MTRTNVQAADTDLVRALPLHTFENLLQKPATAIHQSILPPGKSRSKTYKTAMDRCTIEALLALTNTPAGGLSTEEERPAIRTTGPQKDQCHQLKWDPSGDQQW